jgi:hypothetical protein
MFDVIEPPSMEYERTVVSPGDRFRPCRAVSDEPTGQGRRTDRTQAGAFPKPRRCKIGLVVRPAAGLPDIRGYSEPDEGWLSVDADQALRADDWAAIPRKRRESLWRKTGLQRWHRCPPSKILTIET